MKYYIAGIGKVRNKLYVLSYKYERTNIEDKK